MKKMDHVQKRFRECNDAKNFHRQLNSILGKNNESTFPLFSETITMDAFNQYFAEVGPKMANTIEITSRISFIHKQLQSMFLPHIKETEVEKLLKDLKSKILLDSDGL